MKKFLLVMTAIVVLSLALATTVMAADDSYFTFKKTELNYAESGKTIQIDVVAAQDFITPAYNLRVEYDADLWAISSITTGGGKEVAGGKNVVAITTGTFDSEDMVEVGEVDTVLKFKIKALKDDASFGTSTFKFALANILNEEMSGYAYEMTDFGATVTVTDTRSFAPAHKDAEVAVAERTAEFTGASGQVYTNVWVGTYTVTFNDDAVTGIKLAFNGKEETVAVEGAGTAVVDVAIVGKAGDVSVSVVK